MFKSILIPVDVAVPEETQTLLAAATELTKNWDCTRHVVTVVPTVGMPIVSSYFDENFEVASQKAATQELTKAVRAAGIDARTHVLNGRIYDAVITQAKESETDLIIIGAQQPDIKDYLLGSNAARIVRHATQSVMVLRV